MRNKIFFLGLLLVPFFAHGATLSLLPASGAYSIGDVFQVSVYTSSPTESINAVQGTLSFPQANLEVVSLSKTSSIIGLWVQEPTFSNLGGLVNFEGAILNPGFTGSNGKILTVIFRAKAGGTLPVIFTSSAVLANDGQGTNVLKGFSGATFIIGDSQTKAGSADATSILGELGTPGPVVITSSTHPDPSLWYNSSTVVLNWKLPTDSRAVRYSFDHSARTVPVVDQPSLLTSKTFSNIQDGIWYMHVRVKNDKGWGAVSHFRVGVDTIPPEAFKIVFPHGSVTEDPRPVVYFNTKDSGSGIAYYNIKIDDNTLPVASEADINSNPYAIPPQFPGKRTILVQAVDKAGNSTTETSDFEITSINPPKIVDFPTSLQDGDNLRIRGTTYEGATVTATLKDKDGKIETETTTSTGLGDFGFIWAKHLNPGVYTMTFEAINVRGATSLPTEPRVFEVKPKALFVIGSLIVDYVSIILFFAFCAAGLLGLLWYLYRHFLLSKAKLRRELKVMDHDFHKAFNLLAADFESEIHNLEKVRSKRRLTIEEEGILKKMHENLKQAEEFLEKDIENIENKL